TKTGEFTRDRILAHVIRAAGQDARSLRRIIERRIELSQQAQSVCRLAVEGVAESIADGHVRSPPPRVLRVVFELVVADVCSEVHEALAKSADPSKQEVREGLLVRERAGRSGVSRSSHTRIRVARACRRG